MLPTKFCFVWPSSLREDFFYKSTNQTQELFLAVMFVNGSGRNEQSASMTLHRCFLPRFSSFDHAVSEEKFIFRNRPIRSKNCLWRPCLSTDQDEMNNLHRPYIDASYQDSVHLALQFHRRIYF